MNTHYSSQTFQLWCLFWSIQGRGDEKGRERQGNLLAKENCHCPETMIETILWKDFDFFPGFTVCDHWLSMHNSWHPVLWPLDSHHKRDEKKLATLLFNEYTFENRHDYSVLEEGYKKSIKRRVWKRGKKKEEVVKDWHTMSLFALSTSFDILLNMRRSWTHSLKSLSA